MIIMVYVVTVNFGNIIFAAITIMLTTTNIASVIIIIMLTPCFNIAGTFIMRSDNTLITVTL